MRVTRSLVAVLLFAAPLRGQATEARTLFDGRVTLYGASRDGRLADLDQDGRPDLVTVGSVSGDGQLRTHLGTGLQDFQLETLIVHPALDDVRAVDVGDVDGDGHADAMAYTGSAGNLVLALGAGDGTLTYAGAYDDGSGAFLRDAILVDLDVDGDLDVALAVDFEVQEWRSPGDGTLVPGAVHPLPSLPSSFAVGDVDQDGVIDLTTLCFDDLVVQATGPAGLSAPALVAHEAPDDWGDFPEVTLGDADGDGWIDAILRLMSPHRLVISRGGAGGLSSSLDPAIPVGVGNHSNLPRAYVTFIDVTTDGVGDLTVWLESALDESVEVFERDGLGGFLPGAVTSQGGQPLIADLDDDGVDDVLRRTGNMAIFERGPDVLAQPPVLIIPGGGSVQAHRTRAGDLDGDGDADLVSTALGGAQGLLLTHEGHGDGTFEDPVSLLMPGFGEDLELIDSGGDGHLDAVVGHAFTDDFSLRRGLGTGGFLPAVTHATPSTPRRLAVGDLDGDGLLDVVGGAHAQLGTPGLSRALAGGPASFAPSDLLHPGDVNDVALGDLDADGHLDLALIDDGGIHLFTGTGTGDATLSHTTPLYTNHISRIAVGDVTEDGRADVVLVGTSQGPPGEAGVYVSLPAGGLAPMPLLELTAQSDVLLTDVDLDGRVDIVSRSGLVNFSGHAVMRTLGDGVLEAQQAYACDFVSSSGVDYSQRFDVADLDGDRRPDLLRNTGINLGTEIVLHLNRDDDGWLDVGGGLGDGGGTIPRLTGFGSLEPGSQAGLRLSRALAGSTTALVLGLSALEAPFKGGVLVPSPDVIAFGLPVDGDGDLLLPIPWPVGLPAGTALAVQHWVSDPSGPFGFTASNGLITDTP